MIDRRWHFCRWPKAGRCQQRGRQMACVLAPHTSSPLPSWPSPAAARKGAVWTTRKTARERGREDRKIEALPFPHPQKHLPAEPKGTSLEGRALCQHATWCCLKVRRSVTETRSCVWSYKIWLCFCFSPRLFLNVSAKLEMSRHSYQQRWKASVPNAWDTATKVEISQPTCPSSDAHWKWAKQQELISEGNIHLNQNSGNTLLETVHYGKVHARILLYSLALWTHG